ncbi:MAG: radical SAM family heme chaperone HemW [bacterium]
MAGIYIHIPFCRRKCHYCNFFSLASSKFIDSFVESLLLEIKLEASYLGVETVETIYFGGGTPSLLPPLSIEKILDAVRDHFPLSRSPEITLEANPDDLNSVYLQAIHDTGINRLSIGVQSFFDEDLKFLNRTHSAESAENSVRAAKEAGFSNLSIDLIYGIPGLTADRWEQNLDKSILLEVPHISSYALTVEKHTALDLFIRQQKVAAPDEEQSVAHFRLLMDKMKKAGFLHYEISNFCKEGSLSIHNSNYWKGFPYLGLGPSAHSFNERSRKWNLSGLAAYIENIRSGAPFSEKETLTATQPFNEYVMTSLRTMWGCSKQKIISDFGFQISDFFSGQAEKFIAQGLIKEISGIYYLTDEGKLFADGIASNLFLVEP